MSDPAGSFRGSHGIRVVTVCEVWKMSIYDLLVITALGAGALGFVMGVVTTIKVDDMHERISRK